MDELTDRGIAAAKAGNKPVAQKLLEDALRYDTDNLQAWLWLSGVIDTIEEKIECLDNVVRLDPSNDAAMRGLLSLRERQKKKERINANNAFILDETDPISLELLSSPSRPLKPPQSPPVEDALNIPFMSFGGNEMPSQPIPDEPGEGDLDQRLKQVATSSSSVFPAHPSILSGRLNQPSDPSHTVLSPPSGPASSSVKRASQPRSTVFDVPSQPFSTDLNPSSQSRSVNPPSSPKPDTLPADNGAMSSISPSSRPRQPHTPIYNPFENEESENALPLDTNNRQNIERKSKSRPAEDISVEKANEDYEEEKGLSGFGSFMLVLISIIILAILIMAYYFYRYM
jgi:hypothetical protein